MAITYSMTAQFKLNEGTTLAVLEPNSDFTDNAVLDMMYEKIAIPVETTDVNVNFGKITTAKYIWISSDKDIIVNLNGSIPIPVKKWMWLHTSVTSLTIDNINAAVANVIIRLAGV